MSEYTLAILKLIKQPGNALINGDFLLNFSDTVAKNKISFPVMCFCKDPVSNYIMIPDGFSIWKDRIALLKEIDKANQRYPWKSKIDKGFWMGALNGLFFNYPDLWYTNQRSRVVLFSLKHPDLVFARFVPFIDEDRVCKEMKEWHSYITHERISQAKSCKYKYQIDVEGWGCGFHRTQWVLYSNCVSVKQKGPNTQWYYNGLKPYIHYVPYEEDCSDLERIINWLKDHDEEANQIATAGRQFALDYLNTNMIYLYLYHVLLSLNQLNTSIR